MTNFTELGLDARLLKSLEAEGYAMPTPIQAQAIPAVMAGSDLLGIAQTGTGKTAAFALPILHRLAANRQPAQRRGCRVLVLSPTRELASQIADSFKTYGRHIGVSVATVFGGVGHRPQINAMARGVDVLVATPGRLLDLTGERHVDLRSTEIFVLDEADQMLDLGFLPPIRKVVAQFTIKRQNLFFSATMPSEIGKLAGELLNNPVKVSVAPAATTVERVSQRVIHVPARDKKSVLVELLNDPAMVRALVFTRTKRGADKVATHLEDAKIRVAAIHGNKSQGQRERALEQFRRSQIRVLVATDIAARGIDIDNVSHVINFELPEVPEAYVHRIGRTARAGAEGVAISLCDADERDQLRGIERLTRQAIPQESRGPAGAMPVADSAPRVRHNENGGRSREDSRHRGRSDRGGYQARAPRGDRGGAPRSADRIASDNAEFGTTFRPDNAGGYNPLNADRSRPDVQDDRAGRGDRKGDRGGRSFAPRGDRKPHGEGFKGRGDNRKPQGDGAARGDFAPRGDRKPNGDGFAARGADRNERGGERKPNGGGFKPRGDGVPRGDRNDRGSEHKPRGDSASRGPRKDGAPRREGGGQRGPASGKPGGYQGLKRGGGGRPSSGNRHPQG